VVFPLAPDKMGVRTRSRHANDSAATAVRQQMANCTLPERERIPVPPKIVCFPRKIMIRDGSWAESVGAV
jgi:hypothetical protein